MKNMSFDDLSLLLGVIEIRVVLYILVHGLWFPVLYCDIFTYYVSVVIHSLLRLIIMWNLFVLVLTWPRSMYYNCSILHLASCVGEVCWDLFHDEFIGYSPCFLFYGLDHYSYGPGSKERKKFHANALVATHVCFVMMFVSHVDITFSCMVSTHALRWVLWCTIFFLLWNMSSKHSLFVGDMWFVLMIIDDYSRSCAFVPRPYVLWLALLFKWPMLVLRFV
jgi:hypothetical protein